MRGEDLDQMKFVLDDSTSDYINTVPNDNKETAHKRSKRQEDPKTISIDTTYLDEEENDDLAPPKKDVFDRFAGNSVSEQNEDVSILKEKQSQKDENQRHIFYDDSQGSVSFEYNNENSSEKEALQRDIHSDYYEYTDRQQRKEIIGMYKYAKKNIKKKTIFASIFAIILFFIENVNVFIKTPTSILSNPYVLTISNIVVLIICMLFAYEQLYHGIKSIFSKDYIVESIVVIASTCAVVHSLLMLLFINFENTPTLYNFPVALMLVMVLLYSYINVTRERYGFSVISSKGSKFYLEKVVKGDDEAETESFSSTLSEFNGETARVKRTQFVNGYFINTNSTPNLHSYLGMYFIFALLSPAVLAIISLFNDFDFFEAITIWYLATLLMLPIGALFSYSVPFLLGNKRLYNDEVAIIGEHAISEFASTNIVSVYDTTAFPPHNVKLTNFQIFNDFKTEKVLYYAASGFAAVGGPLADVFDSATKSAFQKSKKTKFVCSGKSYLCVKIDGDTIIFADRQGMIAQGIDVGSEKEADKDVSVMYMACNGILCSKMYLNYTIDEEFVDIALFLNKHGIGVGIRSFDPNVNKDLIKWQVNQKRSNIKSIRLSSDDTIPVTTQKGEGKIVSKGHSKSLLKAIPVCKNIAKIRKVTRAFKIISSILGATIVGLHIFGKIATISSFIIAGYYLGIIAIMALFTLILLPSTK